MWPVHADRSGFGGIVTAARSHRNASDLALPPKREPQKRYGMKRKAGSALEEGERNKEKRAPEGNARLMERWIGYNSNR